MLIHFTDKNRKAKRWRKAGSKNWNLSIDHKNDLQANWAGESFSKNRSNSHQVYLLNDVKGHEMLKNR